MFFSICHRPKSSMSETSDSSKLKAALSTPTISTKKDKKENKESSKDKKEKSESSESSRKRSSSGGGKRNKEKPGSNPVAEAAIRVPAPIPEEVTPDPGTPTFGGGKDIFIYELLKSLEFLKVKFYKNL